MDRIKGHNWSGWPGAYCQKCGCEQAIENALALNWYDIWPLKPEEIGPDGKDYGVWWKSDTHKLYVDLCDSQCPADMTMEEREVYWNQIWDAEEAVKAIDPEFREDCKKKDD